MKRVLVSLGVLVWACLVWAAPTVNKQPAYRSWERVSKLAKDAKQPILAFVTIEGDKAATKIKRETVGHAAFKEVMQPNLFFYSFEVPARRVRRRNAYLAEQEKNAPPKADLIKVETADYPILKKLDKAAHKNYPILAVLDADGKVLGVCKQDPDNLSFKQFVEDVQAYFKIGEFTFIVTPKLQKALTEPQRPRAAK